MPTYDIVASGPARPFAISGSLHAQAGGFEQQWSLHDVQTAHWDWQSDRGVTLGGLVTATLIAPGRKPGGGSALFQRSSPGWQLRGGFSVQDDAGLATAEAKARLVDLAAYIAGRLGLSEVHVSFVGDDLILRAVSA